LGGDKKGEIFYLGSVPPGAKTEEAMDFIFTNLEKLEQGIITPYGPTKQEEFFYGGLLTVYGNTVVLNTYSFYEINTYV